MLSIQWVVTEASPLMTSYNILYSTLSSQINNVKNCYYTRKALKAILVQAAVNNISASAVTSEGCLTFRRHPSWQTSGAGAGTLPESVPHAA